MTIQPSTEHPHGLSDREFDEIFTTDKPVIFAYLGYPWLIHRVPRQNLIRSKNSSILLFPIAKRLNTVRDGNEEFLRRVARSLRQHLHI
jgi:phosphoketolase